jgi:hypothetical protein
MDQPSGLQSRDGVDRQQSFADLTFDLGDRPQPLRGAERLVRSDEICRFISYKAINLSVAVCCAYAWATASLKCHFWREPYSEDAKPFYKR